MTTFREYIEGKYSTKEERAKVEELNINENEGSELTGEVSFNNLGFNNLNKFSCSNNKFSSISLEGLNNSVLTYFDMSLSKNLEKEFDIVVLSQYSNLEEVILNNSEKVVGSLESLKNLKNLKILNIQDTAISGDLEYLPLLDELYINGSLFKSYEKFVSEDSKETEGKLNCDLLLAYKKKKLFSEETNTIASATKDNFQEIFSEVVVSRAKGELKNLTVKQEKEIREISNTLDLKKKIGEIKARNSLAQEWLDDNYPKDGICRRETDQENKGKRREEVTKLEINKNVLEGQLDLSDFINLESLNCENNKLTGLDISYLSKLKEVNCSNNQLTSDILNLSGLTNLEKFSGKHNLFTNLEPFLSLKKLKHLELTDNNFSKQDLSTFSELTSLESLWIGNYDRESKKKIYNHFVGSLKPLKNLTKLKELEIGWTNIDDGLRYLSESLERIWCYGNGQYKGYGTLENRSRKIIDKLKNFPMKENSKNFEGWLEITGKDKIDLNSCHNKGNDWEDEFYLHYKEDSHKNMLMKEWKSSLDNQYDYKSWRKDYDEQKNLVDKNKIYPDLAWEKFDQKEGLPFKLFDVVGGRNKIKEQKEKLEGEDVMIGVDELEEYIVKTEGENIKKYANLSYVCGEFGDHPITCKVKDCKCSLSEEGYCESCEHSHPKKTDYLYPAAEKSLEKTFEALDVLNREYYGLGINHLWVDQLCIDQNNTEEGIEEKNREIPKMRYYYNNSTVTFVAMHNDLIEELSSNRFPKEEKNEQLIIDWSSVVKIVTDSPWFTRSWTFQEGWLSKRTLFMFEDILIDGGFLAQVWAFNNPNRTRYNKYDDLKEFYEASKKIATPLGWTYCKERYSSRDVVNLRLDEALREIKDRGRGISVDGVYTILGLLPYGDKVKVNYKPRTCPSCPEKRETKECQTGSLKHAEKEKEWYSYTKDDVESALIEVMKEAVKNGYGEPFAWFGSGSNTPGRCWVPEVVFYKEEDLLTYSEEEKQRRRQKNGSTKVAGGMKVNYLVPKDEKKDWRDKEDKKIDEIITGEGIKVHGSKYRIVSCEKSIDSVEEKEIVDGGLHRREVEVKVSDYKENVKVTLWGRRETLEKIKIGPDYVPYPYNYNYDSNYLIVLNKNWKSKNDEPFAILTNKGGAHRIDLVRIGEGFEELEGHQGEKLTIGGGDQEIAQYQVQIQIPPK